jgi:hypothetical protein
LVMAKILSFCWRMVTMPMTFSTMVIVRFENVTSRRVLHEVLV